MRLEDCTKEELIFYIKSNMFWGEEDLTFQVLMSRAEAASKNRSDAGKKSCEALSKYTELLKPYDGKRLIDIPQDILTKANTAFKEFKSYSKKADEFRVKYDKLQKQIDRGLNAKGGKK